MKRFLLAAVIAVALGHVSADKADAQIVYGYTGPTYGGVTTSRTVIGPTWGQTYGGYYSPYTGFRTGQAYATSVYGPTYARAYGYNPWTGTGYNDGYYYPSPVSPFGGYTYRTYVYGRRW
jgi:hypothetical protein